jgi:hypothetical protein
MAGLFCISAVGQHDIKARERLGIGDLFGVPAEVQIMRRSLMSLGLAEHLPFEAGERSHDALEAGLTFDAPGGVETLVIYCTGHGVSHDGRYHMLLPSGMPFKPARLIEPLGKWPDLREVALIVDTCSAEPGLDGALAEIRLIKAGKIGFWGIAASRRLEVAGQKSFATAFASVIAGAVRPSWTASHLDPGTIAQQVNRAVGAQQTVWLAEGHPARPCQSLPNPQYQSPRRPVHLPLPAVWATVARGVAAPDLPGFFFTGRDAALRRLRNHLTSQDDRPIAVVRGEPGSGRSALLGHLVLTTHKRGREALPIEARQAWPALPVTIAAARGGIPSVTRTLTLELTGSASPADLADVLQFAPKPLGIVLDDLDEETGPELWNQFLGRVLAVPGVRLVAGLPVTSAISPPSGAVVLTIDSALESTAHDVRDYIARQVQLAVPTAADQDIYRATAALARRAGAEFGVVVALTGTGPALGGRSVDEYLSQATQNLDVAAHRICRTRVSAALGAKAGQIVSAIAALSGYGDGVALPALELAAAASAPGQPPVTAADVAAAVQIMGTLVEQRPAASGTARWRARFGLPGASGYPRAEVFLQRLPQVANWQTVNWRTVDDSVLELIPHACTLGLLPGRLLDEPAFLLDAPPAVVSKAIRQLAAEPDRAHRSRMWSLVPRDDPASERALLLRIGAQRFGVQPLVTAFATHLGEMAQDPYQLARAVDWVQPGRPLRAQIVSMAATSPGPRAAVVTIQNDDSVAFWDPYDGTCLREAVAVPGVPCSVTAATIEGRSIALVSTWERTVWLVPCRDSVAPELAPHLVPPPPGGPAPARPSPLISALHSSGLAVIASGSGVWVGAVGPGNAKPLRKLATMDSGLVCVKIAGPAGNPVAWLVPASGRIRRVSLSSGQGRPVVPFPVPYRPLSMALSDDGGDQALILDVTGSLHMRGNRGESPYADFMGFTDVRAVALDASSVIVSGAAGDAGWLESRPLPRHGAPWRIPLDECPVDIALHGKHNILIARPSGLLSMRRTLLRHETERVGPKDDHE